MKKIAVLFSGKGTNFAYIAKHLHNQSLQIAVALTNNPKAEGIAVAKRYGIPLEIVDSKCFENREAFDHEVVRRLNLYRPDLTVLAGFMRILTPVFTEKIKAINLHPSLLPRHKGLHAIEKSFHDPFPEGGVSVHWVTSELDGGELIVQKKVAKAGHNLKSYTDAVRCIEKEVLREAIENVSADIKD
ncbi:Phosphoribosylglycinamide formyltransferase [hydrothermal vent metagenome]|uniref:phosphoribosylglycinamide formyltransferase 1 n=1 Tax=hydrothermal vent metagenome TaxID=652676 RepID=A0A1W1E9K3_9ZZZZ